MLTPSSTVHKRVPGPFYRGVWSSLNPLVGGEKKRALEHSHRRTRAALLLGMEANTCADWIFGMKCYCGNGKHNCFIEILRFVLYFRVY